MTKVKVTVEGHRLDPGLESRALGKYIGNLYMGCPTVADDLLIMSSSDTELRAKS